ncbi:MAG: anaerobic sulfatase maturase [SAR202 cluster bacterium]|jgi:uncharacterized protein|nr:anaerobic sulfatase maturase [Acidobacteriota bacterium]MDP6372537.1 anaerobic sulfatase maturase [Vicinamibacterales bacterium]MDP6800052.1 anaerobic sulfatase maturase [SAR202 cluster bacterium]MQG58444.1 anaerobic sulfatase maturase [SAR202 cluster bacterium]MQG69278.1 anaerobic sulfatase maturase [SAR202 cluster bacterium]|tara:strand:+ start:1662 stop:2981 length:1320 start_codon:yes stop_codon:yes gene_type:complete
MPPVPPRFHVLAKPTGAICNLDCSYCFFLEKEQLYPGSSFRMSDEILEAYIRQLIETHRSDTVTVAWQGGEPTLMGLDFYRRAAELEQRFKKPGMRFENTMQTNGVLLDDEWCEFFKVNDFLVGLSLDGPREMHDHYRVDKSGDPTFDRVMHGLRLLQKHEVEYNLLTTVNSRNASRPLEVYRFLRGEAKTTWIQFIPVVERVNDDGGTLRQQGTKVADRSVTPEQFGNFLSVIFDEWVSNDVGQVYVQTFEAAVRNWLGLKSSGMCVFDRTCGHGLALEHTGDLYSCDHFVEPDYLVGNILDTHMREVTGSEQQHAFGLEKLDGLPKYCQECDVRFACHGECPKSRFLTTPDGEPGLNYLCAGYKAFFHHIDRPVKLMTRIISQGLPAANVMEALAKEEAAAAFSRAGRNDPCPCGSGKKFKKCHGAGVGTSPTPVAG